VVSRCYCSALSLQFRPYRVFRRGQRASDQEALQDVPSLRFPLTGVPRAGLNELEAAGKVLTPRSPKRLAQLRSVSHALVSTFQKHRSKTPTDTIWQPTLQRQFGVIICPKRKLYITKNDLFAAVTPHNKIFFSYALRPSSLHKSSIHVCIEERYVYTLSQIKTYTV